jgi:hypothetical protein
MQKTATPPSGDKHDYFSLRPYWWPNPRTKTGLPYVRRDGQVNPEANSDKFDRVSCFAMCNHARILARAYEATGRKEFAERSALLVRTWFIDPRTRMNPNLNYAQWRPGEKMGSSYGIIRGTTILRVMQSVEMLEGSGAWTKPDAEAWSRWLGMYADWLKTSGLGKKEARAMNNHGTWYDVQVVTFARSGGNPDLAKETLKGVRARIQSQIRPGGQMPQETKRTKSWNYSVMNVNGFMRLAKHGKELGVDISVYKTDQCGSIRDALDFLVPFALGEKRWPYKQIVAFEPVRLVPVLEMAAEVYDDPSLLEAAKTIETGGQKALPKGSAGADSQ